MIGSPSECHWNRDLKLSSELRDNIYFWKYKHCIISNWPTHCLLYSTYLCVYTSVIASAIYLVTCLGLDRAAPTYLKSSQLHPSSTRLARALAYRRQRSLNPFLHFERTFVLYTFSMSLFGSKPSPFGGLNSNTQPQQQSGGLFGGLNSNSNASKQQQSGGLFGSSTAQPQQQQQNGGLFGSLNNNNNAQQPQQQQSGGLFGGMNSTQQPQQQQQQGGGLFGSAQPQQQQQNGGSFGSTQQNQQQSGGLFGASNNQQQQQGGLFGNSQQQPQQQAGSLTQSQQGRSAMWTPGSGLNPSRLI